MKTPVSAYRSCSDVAPALLLLTGLGKEKGKVGGKGDVSKSRRQKGGKATKRGMWQHDKKEERRQKRGKKQKWVG
jgi:hypothetical protein